MKKTHTLRGLLGVSQDDLALLLKVTRSRFAKYESGTRNIPHVAAQLLSEMVQYMCDTSIQAQVLVEQYLQKLRFVERLQQENNYLQEATARKIKYVEEKCGDYLKALKLVEFLSQRDVAEESEEAALLRTISAKASQGLKFQGLNRLFQLEMKLETLQTEKLLLDYEVIKMNRALENIGCK